MPIGVKCIVFPHPKFQRSCFPPSAPRHRQSGVAWRDGLLRSVYVRGKLSRLTAVPAPAGATPLEGRRHAQRRRWPLGRRRGWSAAGTGVVQALGPSETAHALRAALCRRTGVRHCRPASRAFVPEPDSVGPEAGGGQPRRSGTRTVSRDSGAPDPWCGRLAVRHLRPGAARATAYLDLLCLRSAEAFLQPGAVPGSQTSSTSSAPAISCRAPSTTSAWSAWWCPSAR